MEGDRGAEDDAEHEARHADEEGDRGEEEAQPCDAGAGLWEGGHDDSRERRRKREGVDVDARRDEGRAVAHAAGDEEDDERNDGEQKCRRGKPQPREEQDFVLFDFAVRMLLPHIDSLPHNSKFVNSVADARQE